MDALRASYYLRLSVTGKCNLRCLYCRPASGSDEGCQMQSLDDEELVLTVAALNQALGLSKVRLTGGEPLLRPRLSGLVLRLREALPGVELALTTNGSLLAEQAVALKRAGLDSINVSLDAADPHVFARISRGGDLSPVLQGLKAARSAGFEKIKTNAVLLRNHNRGALVDLARLSASFDCEIRFIELMPFGEGAEIFETEFLGADKALEELKASLDYLSALPDHATARRHLFREGDREIRVGFITTMSDPFCGGCDRLRLDSEGRLFTCLRSEESYDLAGPLRAGNFTEIRDRARRAACRKEPPPSQGAWPRRSMAGIGG